MEQIVGVGHYHHENSPSCYLYNIILFVIDSMGGIAFLLTVIRICLSTNNHVVLFEID